MFKVKVQEDGSIFLPQQILEELGVKPGYTLALEPKEGYFILRKPTIFDYVGQIPASDKPKTWDEERAAAREYVVQKYLESLSEDESPHS